MYKAKELLFILQKLPGAKIVTIALRKDKVVKFDISKDGIVGYEPFHEELFLYYVNLGIKNGGGLIISQFLKKKYEYVTPNGKKIKVPYKNLYGIYLGNNTYKILNAQEVEEANTIDHKTGKKLPKAEGTFYKKLEFDLLA